MKLLTRLLELAIAITAKVRLYKPQFCHGNNNPYIDHHYCLEFFKTKEGLCIKLNSHHLNSELLASK